MKPANVKSSTFVAFDVENNNKVLNLKLVIVKYKKKKKKKLKRATLQISLKKIL